MNEPNSKPDLPEGKLYRIIMFEEGTFEPDYTAVAEAWKNGSGKMVLEACFILPEGGESVAGQCMFPAMLALQEKMFGLWIKGVRQ